MAYDRQQLRLEFGFLLNGTPEVAYTGISFSTVVPGFVGAAAALAEYSASADAGQDLLDITGNFMSTTQLGWSDYSLLKTVKVAALDTAGHYLAEPFLYEDPDFHVGAMAGVPPQCTVVLSLRSGFTLGRANYGRMYLPHTKPAFTAGFPYIPSASTAAISLAGKVFVNALTTRIQEDTTPLLVPTIMSAVGAGTAKSVLSVAVGNVVDTQRRRREQLTEVYDSTTLA